MRGALPSVICDVLLRVALLGTELLLWMGSARPCMDNLSDP